jgi:hypothetical protein
MNQTATAFTGLESEFEAAKDLAQQVSAALGNQQPDAVILFVSPKYDYHKLLSAFKEFCSPKFMVGCSSAGEFVKGKQSENAISLMAIKSDEMFFAASISTGLKKDVKQSATDLVAGLHRDTHNEYPHRTLLLLTDALSGRMDDFIEEVTLATDGEYQLFGGGAGDDDRFTTTHVFKDLEVASDAAVALEILSKKPLGLGVKHAWVPTGKLMRVTESEGMRLVSLNSTLAVEVIEEFARETGQKFDRQNPVPFFLHNTLGIQTEEGFKLRVPLMVQEDGSLICAADIPAGATVSMMTSSGSCPTDAASAAVKSALNQIEGRKVAGAMFFDCVATRLRMGGDFGIELKAVQDLIGEETTYAGCNTYGQIARAHGQFKGFHNCTAVVCLIPE